MARLVIKNGYLKGGKAASHLNHLVKYIATRDGVEKVSNAKALWNSTKKQQSLITQIIREFPDSKESLEYEDYIAEPNRENASEFVSITLEQHIEQIGDKEKYLDYIANRPRVEKFDTHGLFTVGEQPLILSQTAKEIAKHTGNVWTPIISLRREDAEKFGFENAQSWKALISSKAMELAESLKIHPDNLKWYAAFHNESHHPHVHMICYSTNPNEGYLTKVGIRKMKSALATEIFRQELIPLYGEKTQRRDDLAKEARIALRKLLIQMQSDTLRSEKVEELITYLAECLKHTTGKKQYGYLKAELKNVVDEIVDELAKDERVGKAYTLWQKARGQIESIYTETPSQQLPLSKCSDFKSIRNMVIKEAMEISKGEFIFDESETADSIIPESPADSSMLPDSFPPENADDIQGEFEPQKEDGRHHRKSRSPSWWSENYKQAKQFFYGDQDAGITQDFVKAYSLLLLEAELNNPLAMYDLGRMNADGLGCSEDADKSHQWYEKALTVFHAAESEKPWKYTQYRIGKMYAAGLGAEQDYVKAAQWLTQSASEKYKYAEYSLADLYYRGNGVEQDYQTAFELYLHSAKQGFPYASFETGKMLRDGIGCDKNEEKAQKHFSDAFHGFTSLEKQSHDDKLQYRLGWMLLNGIGTEKDILQARSYFEKAALVGNSFASYQLGKLYLGGEGILKDIPEALRWFSISAQQKNQFAEYALGCLYLKGEDVPKDVAKAISYLKSAAINGNEFAEYRLGKLYLTGEDVSKNVETALQYLTASANQGNQYAQYTLGKLYLMGKDILKDKEEAVKWFTLSVAQGNIYAQFFLDHIDEFKEPSVMLAATRLLHHMSRIIGDTPPARIPPNQRADRKLLQKIRAKKQAQGQKQDDHEQSMHTL